MVTGKCKKAFPMLPQLMKMGLKDQECYLSSLVLYTKKHIFYSFKHDKCHLLYIFGKLIKIAIKWWNT